MAKLYFFEGRNTGIYAESASAARKKCRRGCGKLVKVLNKKPPKGGGWDRTRKDGKSPAKSKYGKGRGYGPPRKKKKEFGGRLQEGGQITPAKRAGASADGRYIMSPDGKEMTHRMFSGEMTDDQGRPIYYAAPSIMPDENGQLKNYGPGSREAIARARQLGEFYTFPTDKRAKEWAAGSYKYESAYPDQVQMPRDNTRRRPLVRPMFTGGGNTGEVTDDTPLTEDRTEPVLNEDVLEAGRQVFKDLQGMAREERPGPPSAEYVAGRIISDREKVIADEDMPSAQSERGTLYGMMNAEGGGAEGSRNNIPSNESPIKYIGDIAQRYGLRAAKSLMRIGLQYGLTSREVLEFANAMEPEQIDESRMRDIDYVLGMIKKWREHSYGTPKKLKEGGKLNDPPDDKDLKKKILEGVRGLNSETDEKYQIEDEILQEIAEAIYETSYRYNLDPAELTAQIYQESLFDPNAKSDSGPIGLGQFTYLTGKSFGLIDEKGDRRTRIWDAVDASGQFLASIRDNNIEKGLPTTDEYLQQGYNQGEGSGTHPTTKEYYNYKRGIFTNEATAYPKHIDKWQRKVFDGDNEELADSMLYSTGQDVPEAEVVGEAPEWMKGKLAGNTVAPQDNVGVDRRQLEGRREGGKVENPPEMIRLMNQYIKRGKTQGQARALAKRQLGLLPWQKKKKDLPKAFYGQIIQAATSAASKGIQRAGELDRSGASTGEVIGGFIPVVGDIIAGFRQKKLQKMQEDAVTYGPDEYLKFGGLTVPNKFPSRDDTLRKLIEYQRKRR